MWCGLLPTAALVWSALYWDFGVMWATVEYSSPGLDSKVCWPRQQGVPVDQPRGCADSAPSCPTAISPLLGDRHQLSRCQASMSSGNVGPARRLIPSPRRQDGLWASNPVSPSEVGGSVHWELRERFCGSNTWSFSSHFATTGEKMKMKPKILRLEEQKEGKTLSLSLMTHWVAEPTWSLWLQDILCGEVIKPCCS